MKQDEIQTWLDQARKAGLNNEQIHSQLKVQGWNDKQINELFIDQTNNTNQSTKVNSKERLTSNRKYQIFQKIIIGWLIGYIILRIIFLILVLSLPGGIITGSFFIISLYSLFFIVPGVIILIGLVKLKAWAYWIYGIALFGSLTSFLDSTINTNLGLLIFEIVMTIISIIILVLIFKLYNFIFPSKLRLQKEQNST
ncbi:MAG: hypothetical protein Q8P20_07400 [bacterium]|nr:hypothetical protein [bacterium]